MFADSVESPNEIGWTGGRLGNDGEAETTMGEEGREDTRAGVR